MATPDISQADMAAFHATHFSTTSTAQFSHEFLGPVEDGDDYGEEGYYEEIEDDGLGYYDDGVKRTLTDEQISIFRHSEIQALLRARQHAEDTKEDQKVDVSLPVIEEGELEEEMAVSEYSTPASMPPPSHTSQSTKKKGNKKVQKARQAQEKGFFKKTIKPDLRKRTWDKVESGMDGLDYDEDSGSSSHQKPAPQRRRISYDDA